MQVHRTPSEALRDSDILIAWGANPEGLIEWSSPAWRHFTGISATQQTKHQWQMCLHPEDKSISKNDASDDKSQRPRIAREFRLLHHDGTFHRVLGYVHFSHDQTSSEPAPHAACFEIKTIAANVAPAAQDEIPKPQSLSLTDQAIQFDHQAIRDLFGNDSRSLRELAELFDTTCEECLEFLASAFTTSNQHDLFNAAHRLKGAIANMNAPQVLESCQQLEEAIQANEIAKAENISPEVIRSVIQLRTRVAEEFRT